MRGKLRRVGTLKAWRAAVCAPSTAAAEVRIQLAAPGTLRDPDGRDLGLGEARRRRAAGEREAVTAAAARFAVEDVEAPELAGTHRGAITAHVLIEGRVVALKRPLVSGERAGDGFFGDATGQRGCDLSVVAQAIDDDGPVSAHVLLDGELGLT